MKSKSGLKLNGRDHFSVKINGICLLVFVEYVKQSVLIYEVFFYSCIQIYNTKPELWVYSNIY